MVAWKFWCAVVLLMIAIAILIIAYIAHMASIMQDIADEKAEHIADRRFDEMLETAEVKVLQRLVIVDEMRRS